MGRHKFKNKHMSSLHGAFTHIWARLRSVDKFTHLEHTGNIDGLLQEGTLKQNVHYIYISMVYRYICYYIFSEKKTSSSNSVKVTYIINVVENYTMYMCSSLINKHLGPTNCIELNEDEDHIRDGQIPP